MPFITNIKCRAVLGILSLALIVAVVGCDKPDTRGQGVPSVFVIVLDAANAEYFGCYGDPDNTSPNIDAFAAECVVFENAYSQTATTVSSTASLMTGTRATTHQMTDKTVLRSDLATMPEALTNQGMTCYGVIGNPFAGAPATGLNRGYAECIEVYALEALQKTRQSEESSKFKVTLPEDINEQVEKLLPKIKSNGVFSYIHILQPHKPYTPPDKYLEKFGCRYTDWDHLHDKWMNSHRTGKVDSETIKDLEARYRANIAYVDEAVGELLKMLKKAGLYDDSLIILTSDHGEAFFKHRFFGHNATLYDDMTRVPLMIRFPRNQKVAPRRMMQLAETIDLMPTIFDYLGLDAPDVHEGDSLWRLIAGAKKNLPGPEVITCTIQRTRHAVRIEDYKYIYNQSSAEELYDLRHDPYEQHNLASEKPEALKRLREFLSSRVNLLSGVAVAGNSKLRDDPAMDAILDSLGYAGGANEELIDHSRPEGATTQPTTRPATTAPADLEPATTQPAAAIDQEGDSDC